MFFPLAPAALLALAIHSASASPVELSVSSPDVSPNPLQKRFGFLYRFCERAVLRLRARPS